jgi:hypothetical protein
MKRIFHFRFNSLSGLDKDMPSVADIPPTPELPSRKASAPPVAVLPASNGKSERPHGYANGYPLVVEPKPVAGDALSRPAMYAKFIESSNALTAFQYVCAFYFCRQCLTHVFFFEYRLGAPVVLDGNSLSIPAVTAAARYGAAVTLDDSPQVRNRVLESRKVIVGKVTAEKSVYGVSTGFGGSGRISCIFFPA